MRAAWIAQTGAIADVVQISERPAPSASAGQIVVDVEAAAINPRDWLLVEGRYVFARLAGPLPLILGSDGAGVVSAVGPRATGFQAGDRVLFMQTPKGRFGAFAEQIAVHASAACRLPEGLSARDGASVGVAGLTALQAVRDLGAVGEGDRVLVIGGSGGVGSFAVQIACILGAQVAAVCSRRNAELVQGLGAEDVIAYDEQEIGSVARGFDVVFDTIGRERLATARPWMAPGGRYITTVPTAVNTLDQARTTLLAAVRSSTLTSATVLCRSRGDDLSTLVGWMADGRLRALIDSEHSLDEVPAALERSRTRRARGRIVLHP